MKKSLPLIVLSGILIAIIGINAFKGSSKDSDIGADIQKDAKQNLLSAKVKSSKEQLLGELDSKSGLRVDVSSWIKTLKVDDETRNLLINIALADQKIFSVYESKELANKLDKEQSERFTCLLMKSENKKDFAILMSDLRSRIFNSEDRVRTFHLYSRIKESKPTDRSNLAKTCKSLTKGKVDPLI